MKHFEVKVLVVELRDLISYCALNEINLFHLQYGLDINHEILSKAESAIDRNLSQELKDIEKKVWDLAKTINNEHPIFLDGVALLSDVEKKSRFELLAECNEALKEENDVQLYYLDKDKLSDIRMSRKYFLILRNFVKI